MITQILTFCIIISLLNGSNGQGFESKTSNQPQSDGTYVFDLPPLQLSPLQIRLRPSQSSLFLVRQNDEEELIPIEQNRPKNTLPVAPELNNNQNQILSMNAALPKPTPQPLPQVTAQAVSQTSTQANTQLPKESSVTYDAPTFESFLKELSFYKPYELPPQSVLYQSARTQQFSTQSSSTPEASKKNTRILPSITLPPVTIQSENGPIQTIAIEFAEQTLPFETFTIPQRFITMTAQKPTPPVEKTPSPTTDSIPAQTIQTQAFSIGAQALPTLEPITKPKQKVVDIRTFVERSKLSLNPSLKPIEPIVKPIVEPTVQPIINTSIQKPILTSITRTPGLSVASLPIQFQTLSEPVYILVENVAQIEPYKFGFFTDSSRNGAGIGTNELRTIGSSAGVKVNAQLTKPTKKPIILFPNQSVRKFVFTQN
jgi:hypothetical protein